MKRSTGAKVGWLLIAAGVISLLIARINPYSLISIFIGFFIRLIFNSEKYKFFKALNLELLHAFGSSPYQQRARRYSLLGFYFGIFDLLVVIILPFIIIPMINLPWYCDSLIGIVYYLALRPIFAEIDEIDREQIEQIVSSYPTEANLYRNQA